MSASREAIESVSEELIRVGIVSDTHGRLSDTAFAALAESDVIIHAGDIGGPDILRALETLAPVHAVLGNNDFDEYGEAVGRFARPVIGGVRFLVAHYPRDVRIGPNGCPGVAPGDPIPQVCVHGHTHVPQIVSGREARPADYVICPGSPSRPRGELGPCVAFVEIESGRVVDARLESLRTQR